MATKCPDCKVPFVAVGPRKLECPKCHTLRILW